MIIKTERVTIQKMVLQTLFNTGTIAWHLSLKTLMRELPKNGFKTS